MPTLVIWGEKDTALLPGNLEGLDQVVPTLTVRRIPDGTHWVVREKAADVNRLIREFLAQPQLMAASPRRDSAPRRSGFCAPSSATTGASGSTRTATTTKPTSASR